VIQETVPPVGRVTYHEPFNRIGVELSLLFKVGERGGAFVGSKHVGVIAGRLLVHTEDFVNVALLSVGIRRQRYVRAEASRRSASPKEILSCWVRKVNTFPPAPQPKQWYNPFSLLTVNEGVFSV